MINLRNIFSLPKKSKFVSLLLIFVLFLPALTLFLINNSKQKFIRSKAQEVKLVSLSPVRGQAGDLWADVVLGQRNFNEIAPYETVADRLFNPGGVVIDKTVTPNILYVLDSGNNRVLGINLEECLQLKRTNPNSRCQAIKVIGQPDLNSNACNGDSGFQNYPNRAPASAESLCYSLESATSPEEQGGNGVGLFIDNEGNLYLPDSGNNRILKYNHVSNRENSQIRADEIWGQTNFSNHQCNRGGIPSAESLCFPQGTYTKTIYISVAITRLDRYGSLWVADSGNSRVLRFPKQEDGTIRKRADLVLGQNTFDSGDGGDSLNRLRVPSSLDFDSEGKLYVVDQQNNRVLVFSPPFANGMTGELFGSNFNFPMHIKIEKIRPGQDKIWISDVFNGMVECWNNQGTQVLKVIGKESYLPDGRDSNEFSFTLGSFDFDSTGNLFASKGDWGYYKHDILFCGNSDRNVPRSTFRLFSPLEGNSNRCNSVSNRGFNSGRGIVVTDEQIIINDGNRLLFWNSPDNLFNGRSIDGLIARYGNLDRLPDGQPNFLSQGIPGSFLKKDQVGNLWMTTDKDRDISTAMSVFRLPLTTGQRPFKSIFFDSQFCFLTLEGERICNPDPYWALVGLSPAADASYVWISHPLTNRVFRIRNPLSDSPRIDVVLGQENSTEICCNREKNPDGTCKPWEQTTKNPPLNMLCHPGAISQDNFGNLYVSDYYLEDAGNFRILIFRPEDLPIDNTQTLYDVSASKEIENIAAFDMIFDSQNRMISCPGLHPFPSSNFLSYFDNPLDPNTTRPTGYFNDYFSLCFALAFDKSNNLFATDHNRSRVLVYKNPLNSPRLLHHVDQPQPNVSYSSPFDFSGWTIWRDGQKVEKVEFYMDLPKGQVGKYGEALTDQFERPDLCNLNPLYCRAGWKWRFNPSWVNNGPHKVYVYAYDDQRGYVGEPVVRDFMVAVPVTPTPTPTQKPTPTLAPTLTPTLGPRLVHNVDSPGQNSFITSSFDFSGWTAWEGGGRVEKVEFYLDYPNYVDGNMEIGYALCNEYRHDLDTPVMRAYKNSGWHWHFNLSSQYNGWHKLYIYAYDSTQGFLGSPIVRDFLVAVPTTVPTPTNTLTPRPTQTPTPTPTSGPCPLRNQQDITSSASPLSLNNYWQQTGPFMSNWSGYVDKIAVKVGAYNGGVFSCKLVNAEDGSDASLEIYSQNIPNSAPADWRELRFSPPYPRLYAGEYYHVYCRGPASYARHYWEFDVVKGEIFGKTFKVYLCQ